MWRTWLLTVASEMTSSSAISGFERPAPMSRSTSIGRLAGDLDARQLEDQAQPVADQGLIVGDDDQGHPGSGPPTGSVAAT